MSFTPVQPGTPWATLRPDDTWVSCSIRDHGPVGAVRHIVRRGALTTVCGCSASYPEVWRHDRSKPRCAACVAQYPARTERNT